jgi:Zn-dependent protease
MKADPIGFLVYMLFRVITVLAAITFHEVAHGYVAYRCGDPTAKMLGRLTLNPIKHMDIIGTLSLFLLGFGWAKPVPVNPRNFSNFRRDDFLVSIAGIVTNLTLFIISTALLFGLNRAGDSVVLDYVFQFFGMFATINLGLAIFNILPIPPLDGFHLLNDTLLGGRLRMNAQFFQTSQLILILLVASGWLNGILSAVMSAVQNGVWNLFSLLTGVA